MLIYFCCQQDWALGVLHAKIIAAITLMGPQWWLKTVIEQVGFRYVLEACCALLFLTKPHCKQFQSLEYTMLDYL